jgi:hypothetical protein
MIEATHETVVFGACCSSSDWLSLATAGVYNGVGICDQQSSTIAICA